jgi:DNA polymerase III subunit gamma/tau
MDNFIVSARKYRPATFDAVVGQVSITTTLKNAIRSNHLAQAYLFCGPRGVGKTTCARIFAKTINCFNLTDKVEPCNQCESCRSFNDSRSFNIHELDAASNNSVDDIRTLIDQVRIPPQIGKYSIYIIDEVHMLSASAFNAFLKTLEEPPKHAVFILATTEKHKIIPTILSRCQIYDFNRIQIEDAVSYIEKISKNEATEYELDGLNIIAQKADGSMRDALSIYDQIVSFSGGKVTYKNVIENLNVLDYDYYFRITDSFLKGNISESFLIFDEILTKGFDSHNFIVGLSKHFRDLLVCKDSSTLQLLEVGNNIKEKYKLQTSLCTPEFLFECLQLCGQSDINFRNSRNQRLHVELTLVQLCQALDKKKSNDELISNNFDRNLKTVKPVEKKLQDSPVISNEKFTTPIFQENIVIENGYTEKYVSTTPSIKSLMKDKPISYEQQNSSETSFDEVAEDKQPAEIKENKFTADQLLQSFNRFLETIKSIKPRLYSTLNTQHPHLSGSHTVEIILSNEALQNDFDKNLSHDMTIFLRDELQNDNIVIEVIVTKQKEHNKLYTAEEKFKHLALKNPALNELKKKLDLDFE